MRSTTPFLLVLVLILPSMTHADDRPTRPFDDAVKASKGALSLSTYLVISKAVDGFEPVKKALPDHQRYLHDLERRGVLFLAGPLSTTDPDDWAADGALVYRVTDASEARRIADADPMHATGARTYTLHRWIINEGVLPATMRLSDQSFTIGVPDDSSAGETSLGNGS